MKSINPYLTFDGNCREAMKFYADALGAELHVMTFGDSKQGAPADADRVMHAQVIKGTAVVMASDTMPGTTMSQGTNFSISVDCESAEEEEKFFAAMSAGGTVTMPLQDTFWGARFGMMKDKFGVAWMFNFDLKKQ